jgi:hypothetical protein
MSADGPGLFDDDIACDVREQFTRMLARQPQVLKGALEVIESGADLARWRGSPHEQKRASTLRRLSQQLSRSQPALRIPKLRKERVPPRSTVTSPDGYCEAQSMDFSTRFAPKSIASSWSPSMAAVDPAGAMIVD